MDNEKNIERLENRVKELTDKLIKSEKESRIRGWRAKIAENVLDEIRSIATEYAFTDGAHHKQYALVRIAKMLDEEIEFQDEGIPS